MFSAAMPAEADTALLWSRRTRRPGRGIVPQKAATGRIELKPAQQRALAALENGHAAELTRGGYQEITSVSRSQAAYDLAELVEAALLERVGSGRATRYRLVRKSQAGHRRWTSDLIRSELTAFCSGRKTWPTASAFKEAGRADLYVAASRYGGIGYWASELGFARPSRAPAVHEPPLARKFAWAGTGALAAALVVAAAAAVVVLNLPRGSTQVVDAAPGVFPSAGIGSRIVAKPAPRQRATRKPAVAVKAPVHRTRARQQATRRAHVAPAEPSSGSATLIVARTYSPPSTSYSPPPSTSSTAAPASHQSTPAPAPSSGPAPLRAPLTASAPNPLKAP
jgi:hypothetical protein